MMKTIFLVLLAGGVCFVAVSAIRMTKVSNTDKQVISLASRIGTCQATDLVFSNVEQSALGLAEGFALLAPNDYKEAASANVTFLHRLLLLQKIRSDTYEVVSGQMMEDKNIVFNRSLFKKVKEQSFHKHLAELATKATTANKNFGMMLENESTSCMNEFPVNLHDQEK